MMNKSLILLANIVRRVAIRGKWTSPSRFYRDVDNVKTVTAIMVATYNVKKALTSKTGLWVSPDIERANNISNSDLPKWSIK